MTDDFSEYLIDDDTTLAGASQKLNTKDCLFVISKTGEVIGAVTQGDMRRAFIKKTNLSGKIISYMNKDFFYLKKGDALQKEHETFMFVIPILDADKKLCGMIFPKNTLLKKIQDEFLMVKHQKLIEVMKLMDERGIGNAFLVDYDNKFLGIIADKDIRNAILYGVSLTEPAESVLRLPSNQTRNFFLGRKKTVLITGGAGFLGTILAEKLLQKEYNVKILDNFTYGEEAIRTLEKNVHFEAVKGDVRHIEDIVNSLRNVDIVVHLAGVVGDPACSISPTSTITQNSLSTLLIARICKYVHINRFIFASSCSVYGFSEGIVDENSPTNPLSLYAKDKLLSEKVLLEMKDESFSPVILRFGTLYGYSHRPRFDLVANLFVAKALKNETITVQGEDNIRPFVHVSDVANAIQLAIEAPLSDITGQIFNVVSENLTIGQVALIVKESVGNTTITHEAGINDKRNYCVNGDKIKRIGFHPKIMMAQGITLLKNKIIEEHINLADNRYNNHKQLTSIKKEPQGELS